MKKLGELGSWKGGATPSMTIAHYWFGGTIYWASSGDIKTKLLSKTANMITDIAVKQSSTALLQAGSILIVTRSGILRKYLPVAINTVPMAINQDIKALIPNGQVNAGYLLQVLTVHGPNILSTCMKAGTTVESVEYTWLKKYQIPLPPLPEQQTISAVLSDIDALITSLDKLIEKKHAIKQATMQQLLTERIRLPDYREQWEVQILGEIAEIIDPHPSHRAPTEDNNGIPFVGIGDISVDGKINHQTSRMVSEKIFEQHNERYNLEDGLIGIGRVASIGKVVRFLPNIGKYVVSPTIAVIKPRKIDIDLLFYCLSSNEVKSQFDRISNGSTRQSVGMNVLRDIQLYLPKSLTEQQAISTILSDMDTEIGALEQKRDKTRALKQGMMQKLLTGKIRLL